MTTQRKDNGAEAGRLHSVRRALAVLEALAARPAGATPKELSLALALHLSTCYRLLNTLSAAGYVRRDAEGLFRLGSRVTYLNHGYLAALRPPAEVLPFVNALSLATGETAILSCLEGNDVVAIAGVAGSRAGAITPGYAGMASPAYAYASGRVLLAALPAAKLEAYLTRCADGPPTSSPPFALAAPHVLVAELETIRQHGYALDLGRGTHEVCCVAAPVPNPGGAIETSLALVAPSERFRQEEPAMTQMVLTVAGAIGSVQATMPARECSNTVATAGDDVAAQAVIDAVLAEIGKAMSRVV